MPAKRPPVSPRPEFEFPDAELPPASRAAASDPGDVHWHEGPRPEPTRPEPTRPEPTRPEPPPPSERRAPAPSAGVELTTEELDALREATRTSLGGSQVFVVAPNASGHTQWENAGGNIADITVVRRVDQIKLLVRDHVPACVVVDADACGCGGPGVLAALRPFPSPCYVVASTPTRTHLISCLAAGADYYFAKPVSIEELLRHSQDHRAA